MKAAVVYVSIYHGNTEKVANVMAKALGADLKKVGTFDPKDLAEYDLIGFGSGIYLSNLHKTILELATNLPQISNKKAFIFSTSGQTISDKALMNHITAKDILQKKGYEIIGEFNCPGLDTRGKYELTGGKEDTKGRPNEEDLKRAQTFADNLKRTIN